MNLKKAGLSVFAAVNIYGMALIVNAVVWGILFIPLVLVLANRPSSDQLWLVAGAWIMPFILGGAFTCAFYLFRTTFSGNSTVFDDFAAEVSRLERNHTERITNA